MTSDTIYNWLLQLGLSDTLASTFSFIGTVTALIMVALIANVLAKSIIRLVIHPLIKKSRIRWDDRLIQYKVIIRCSHLVPIAIIHLYAPVLFETNPTAISAISTIVNTYIIVITLMFIDALLNFLRALWEEAEVGKRYPAKSFTQAAKLIINLIGLVFILAAILGKSPLVFFSGLGAVTAILLLIFKDAILGLVAGFQLSINQMVMVGDWIEMPGRGADGDIIDVSLTTVKVQNWDKTITTIPTYALITDSFRNWRGMSESGGRRIKRAIKLDTNSIKFVDKPLLERLKHIKVLVPYLEKKLSDIDLHNNAVSSDLAELINGRHLTNIGTFRAYCIEYLRNHPYIHQEMTLLVRQLAPSENGLPIEIYVFTNTVEWVQFEAIQSDIFDHLFSVLSEFNLEAFQSPSGADLKQLNIPNKHNS